MDSKSTPLTRWRRLLAAIPKRVVSAFRRHGPRSFALHLLKNGVYILGRLNPSSWNTRSEFDERYRVDTEGIREIGSLDVQSPNVKHAGRYQASSDTMVRDILAKLVIDHRAFTFIDFGAGKGRVLLLAAEYPFAEVVGVEFSPELVEIAKGNLAAAAEPAVTLRANVHCVVADMTEYKVPLTPLICYFYNPCGEPVMANVAARLRESWVAAPRDIYVIYVDPRHRIVFDTTRFWSHVWEQPLFVIYRAAAG